MSSMSIHSNEAANTAPSRGTGIAEIERVTLDGARLRNPGVALSGTCDKLLIGHLGDAVAPGGRVLDLGAGTGANGLYFARIGCSVELVDISADAIRLCQEHAKDLGLSVTAEVNDIRQINLPTNSYDLIILSYILQFVSADDGRQIVRKCISALKPGGSIYISTFSVDENIFKDLIEQSLSSESVKRIDETTFKLSSGKLLHFQTANELLGNCEGLKCRHFFEGRELDEFHDEPHYHSFLSYIGVKPTEA